MNKRILILAALLLGACSPAAATPAPTIAPTTAAPSPTLPPTVESTAPSPNPTAAQASPAPTLDTPLPSPTPPPPADWRELPVIPVVPARAAEIFRRGQELGNNPAAYSKVGDCGSTPAWFLGDFDRGPAFYSLGAYTDLEEVIAAFQGSHGRTSLAAKSGFNASSVMTALWADREQCNPDETPLACEYRIQRPAFAFITLGANDVWHPDKFEPQLRAILEYSIEQGVLPILATKPDDIEGGGELNAVIAALAYEYQLPLWNYWAAVQGLPDGGLQEDGVHITWAPNRFDDPEAMEKGWPVRNLTALQALDAVWRGVK